MCPRLLRFEIRANQNLFLNPNQPFRSEEKFRRTVDFAGFTCKLFVIIIYFFEGPPLHFYHGKRQSMGVENVN